MKFGVQVNCYRTRRDDVRASIDVLVAKMAATLDQAPLSPDCHQTPHIPIRFDAIAAGDVEGYPRACEEIVAAIA